MRRILLGCALSVAAAGLACGGGSGHATGAPISVAGCISQVDGNVVLTPSGSGAGGPVGTSGTNQKRYKLLDDGSTGVSRYVGREGRVTGRPGETQADGTTVLHVTNFASGAECGEVK